MKIAGFLALLVGLLLGGIAISAMQDDAHGAGQRIHDGFESLREGDQAALDRASREAVERAEAQNHEWIGCAIFTIAGIALMSVGAKKSNPESPQPS